MRILACLAALLTSGCAFLGHCGPTPTDVVWDDPDLAAALAAAAPEGWTVHEEPRPPGLPVEHPWLDSWNASIRSLQLREVAERDGHGHEHLHVQLTAPAHVDVRITADRDPEVMRPVVLRLLETLTDGNESERRAWADDLLAEPDLPEGVDYPAPEYRSFAGITYGLDLPPERLRLQEFVDENLVPDGPTATMADDDWSVGVAFSQTIATRDGQEFRASPTGNGFRDTGWREGHDEERVLGDFRAAYASLGVGPAPQDATVGSIVC